MMLRDTRGPIYLAVVAACLLVVFLNTPMKSTLFDMKEVFSLSTEAPHTKISGVTGHLFKGEHVRTFTHPLHFQSKSGGGHKDAALTSSAETKKHHKWAVCTTIHSPTQAIIDFAENEDWAIVVVGDEGMEPLDVKGPKTFVLDAEEQRAMAKDYQELFDMLPWKHFGRKNIGYLYAILHGAEIVWDFDDDNFMKAGVLPQPSDPSTVYRIAPNDDNCIAFNPLPLMGGDLPPTPMWPRGFPYNLIRKPCNYEVVNHHEPDSIAVYQSLADNEPDVDGIYRLTRQTPMNFREDPTKKTLVMPQGVLSPYNAQATLMMKPALWSLLLPVSVHGRVSDIWRSYIAQRLLWDIGQHLAFTPPVVDQFRNPHDPLADMSAEADLYAKSLALCKFLRTWTGTAPTIAGRHEELVVALYERDYIGQEDVLLTQEWLHALHRVGYDFPPLASPAYLPPPNPDVSKLPNYPADESARLTTSAAPAAPAPAAPAAAAVVPAAAVTRGKAHHAHNTKCPTSNIDLFFVTFHRDFPVTSFLMRSVDKFMPCHGDVHILIDEKDMLTVQAWMDIDDPRVKLHIFEIPSILAKHEAYLVQMWAMMWADKYVEKTKSNADYIMFLDTDVVMGLPVTCNSLFDEDGKVYLAGWTMEKQLPFKRAVMDMVGEPADTSYMSYFPFTQPISTFPRMREHIATRLQSPDFDVAFVEWLGQPDLVHNDPEAKDSFSQFAVMGAYLQHHEKELVHPIFCAPSGEQANSDCARWVPPAAHLGWRPCWYVDGCIQGWGGEYRNWKEPRDLDKYTFKYAPAYLEVTEQIFEQGTCFTHYIQNGEKVMAGCTEENSRTIHPELLPYPQAPPSFDILRKTFYMADPHSQELCPSVAVSQRIKS